MFICLSSTVPHGQHTNVAVLSYSPHSVSFKSGSTTECQRRRIRNGCRCGLSSRPRWVYSFSASQARLPLISILAVIIGCCPPFAAIIKSRFGTQDASKDSSSRVQRSTESYKMKSAGSGSTDRPEPKDEVRWADVHGSEEALAMDEERTTVTTTIKEDDREDEIPGPKSGMYRNRPTLHPSRAAQYSMP